jgi:predicted transcriptional regulator
MAHPAEQAPAEDITYPTSIRLSRRTSDRLSAVAETTQHTKTGLIYYAIDALLDYVARTGKLPPIGKKEAKKAAAGQG